VDLIEVKNRKNEISVRHPWELARLEVVNKLLKNVIRNENDFNVLDIGCGDIFFISRLSDLYPTINFYAIDIAFTDEIMEKLKQDIGKRKIHVFKTLDQATPFIKGTADLVLLLDVIEHIEDDKGFLRSLHQNSAVDNETSILITVPAYQSLFCSHDRFLGHYRRYTNRTLHRTIQETGFKKIALGYFFSSLIPPRILQVLKEKIMKPASDQQTTGLVEWNKGQGLTNLIKNFLMLDFAITNAIKKITGISVFGLSNYIICKKQP
jgi:SAM-dependent methyltransferase